MDFGQTRRHNKAIFVRVFSTETREAAIYPRHFRIYCEAVINFTGFPGVQWNDHQTPGVEREGYRHNIWVYRKSSGVASNGHGFSSSNVW